MALIKTQNVATIEITENNNVHVLTKISIMENEMVVNENFMRHVIAPGDDYSNEDSRVQAVCAAIHTPEVIAAHQASQAKVEV